MNVEGCRRVDASTVSLLSHRCQSCITIHARITCLDVGPIYIIGLLLGRLASIPRRHWRSRPPPTCRLASTRWTRESVSSSGNSPLRARGTTARSPRSFFRPSPRTTPCRPRRPPRTARLGHRRRPARSTLSKPRSSSSISRSGSSAANSKSNVSRPAERAKTTPVVGAGREGFAMRSADGAFQLRLRGYIQSDGRFYAGDARRAGRRHLPAAARPADSRGHALQELRLQADARLRRRHHGPAGRVRRPAIHAGAEDPCRESSRRRSASNAWRRQPSCCSSSGRCRRRSRRTATSACCSSATSSTRG